MARAGRRPLLLRGPPVFEFYRRRLKLTTDGSDRYFQLQYRGNFLWVAFCGITRAFEVYTPKEWQLARLMPEPAQAQADNALHSPMPGLVVGVRVAAGDRVYRGQDLVTIESMKMESGVVSPLDGVVDEVRARAGQAVETRMTRLLVREADPRVTQQLVTDGVLPALARVLAGRGVQRRDELQLLIDGLVPPASLSHVDDSAALLADAIEAEAKLLIVADYDCDGATACAVGLRGLRALGADVDYLVPTRLEYGYGLTPEIVDLAAPREPDLIITVDNGIASLDGVDEANRHGIPVLVTDHHLPGAELPRALAILNPNQPGCAFPSKNLIRMAGYGLSIRSSEMTKWLTWVGGMTRNPMGRQGSSVSAPDAVSIAAAFVLPAAYLSTTSGAGSTSIVVGNGEGANFNATNKSVIYIGRCETARVVSRSGDVLTVSTHPSTAGRGLSFNYPAGSPVELVKVVTYRWCPATNTFPRQPYLVWDENLGDLPASWHGMVAASIEDFQAAYDGYSVRVTISPYSGSRFRLNKASPLQWRGDCLPRQTRGRSPYRRPSSGGCLCRTPCCAFSPAPIRMPLLPR